MSDKPRNTGMFAIVPDSFEYWAVNAAADAKGYNEKIIKQLDDPAVGERQHIPVAIPSPFARIDLVKTAFDNIAQTNELAAEAEVYDTNNPNTTRYINISKLSTELKSYEKIKNVIASQEDERLVSQSLDIAELMFNIKELSIEKQIKIIIWKKEEEIKKLKESNRKEYENFAEVLDLYLKLDKDVYNFDDMDNLAIIKYNSIVIGCTSPVTLFFATENEVPQEIKNIKLSEKLFDAPCPLYKRSKEFQKYYYSMFYTLFPGGEKMKSIHNYLEKNKEKCKNIDVNDMCKNSENANKQLEDIAELYKYNDEQTITFLRGKSLYTKKPSISTDFEINASFNVTTKPLVLQNHLEPYEKYIYLNGNTWDKNIKVPYKDSRELEERTLPNTGSGSLNDGGRKYPYLTVGDFLEDYLFELPYKINFDKYYCIGDKSNKKSYLLPLTSKFFEYFKTEDIGDKCKIEIKEDKNLVNFILTVPVSNKNNSEYNFVKLIRKYYFKQKANIDENSNEGGIVILPAGLTLFPFIKISDEMKKEVIFDTSMRQDNLYRIQLIDCDQGKNNNNIELSFFKSGKNELLGKKYSKRTKKCKDNAGSTYYSCGDFDYIQISYADNNAIVLPKWKKYTGESEKEYLFAIDFGTTNTHIEYANEKIRLAEKEYDVDKKTIPFVINFETMQIATLHYRDYGNDNDPKGSESIAANLGALGGDTGIDNLDDIEILIWHEFVPDIIGDDKINSFKFPQRTVIAKTEGANGEVMELGKYNIPFIFEKTSKIYENSRIVTDLKWDDKETSDNEEVVAVFFNQLLMLIRNMVLKNNGKLSNVKFIAFYPSSMNADRKTKILEKLESYVKYYFGDGILLELLMESFAPAYYFKAKYSLDAHSAPILTIDIGGGTTDVAVFISNKGEFAPKCLTSLKFAGDSLFYGKSPLVEAAKESNKNIKNELSNAKYSNFSSQAIAAYMFAREKDENKFFTKILEQPKNRLAFVYFYCAIMYHIAEWLKDSFDSDYPFPDVISFSGMGSQTLSIVDFEKDPKKQKVLQRLTEEIFKLVSGKESLPRDRLKILMDKNFKKETTCKGGLVYLEDSASNEGRMDIEALQSVLYCWSEVEKIDKLTNENTKECFDKLTSYVKAFGEKFIKLMETDFDDNGTKFIERLEVSAYMGCIRDVVKNVEKIKSSIIEEANKLKKTEKIPYSLFFAPIRQQIFDYLKTVNFKSESME
jgi:hypothetical protein